jgi:sugar phosphate isomerase/epimerase
MELSLAPGAGGTVDSMAALDYYLAAVAGAGFRFVSLGLQQLGPALEERGGLDRAAAMVSAHGLTCRDVLSLSVRRDDVETLQAAEQLAEVAGALGAGHVLTLLWTRVSDESLDRLGRCGDVVARSGARLAFEFVPGGPASRISEALGLVDVVGPERMGVMIDTWHFFRGGSTWHELENVPLDRVAFVQFDDALAAESDDVMHESVDRRTWPGEGEFDLTRFAATLTARGWSGLVSIEVLSAELRRLDWPAYTRLAYRTTAPYWNQS